MDMDVEVQSMSEFGGVFVTISLRHVAMMVWMYVPA